MAGYYGFSMSNNAVEAYWMGEKPKSKWTKDDILEAVETINPGLLPLLKKVSVAVLREKLLYNSSWHHTSKYYNKTEFYKIDTGVIEELTVDEVAAWQKPKKEETAERRARCQYLVWSGTRNYPKATKYEAVGVIRGNWFYPDGETCKKNIGSNGFYILEYLD